MLQLALDTELQNPHSLITDKFNNLESFHDLSSLLEIPEKLLYEILIKNKKRNYTEFTIPKRNGGERILHSPKQNLAIIQRKLASILNFEYKSHSAAHGFVNNKSIVTNAKNHLNKRYILNFDLEDFFHTINYGRVRGMFKSYFRFNGKVSSTLANICCHNEGFLPQGASTSPIISNIIAFTLDKELVRLAYTNGCIYTRYADDITISTNRRSFPEAIATRENFNSPTLLSGNIKGIVKKNGFFINEGKTYLRSKYDNQSVTGVKVNEKLNVNRSYIRYIRSLLHSLESNFANDNISLAEERFMKEYNHRHTRSGSNPTIYKVLHGMISHVGHVRGASDFLFRKLGRRYNSLAQKLDKPTIKIINDRRRYEMDSYDVFISHASEDKDSFVRPLAEELEKVGIKVWYDEFTLTWGDRIRDSIDNGLANSKFGIAIISKPYLKKYWAQYEFDGIFQKEQKDNKTYLLPIWHEILKDEIQEQSPTLADRKAISTSNNSISDIVNEVKSLLDEANKIGISAN